MEEIENGVVNNMLHRTLPTQAALQKLRCGMLYKERIQMLQSEKKHMVLQWSKIFNITDGDLRTEKKVLVNWWRMHDSAFGGEKMKDHLYNWII